MEGAEFFREGTLRLAIARRLREIRFDLYGEHGAPILARELNVSAPVFQRYENGEMIPGEDLLRILEVTGVNSRWLLTGQGPRFDDRSATS